MAPPPGEHLLARMSHRHFILTTSRNTNLTTGGKQRPPLSMYIKNCYQV